MLERSLTALLLAGIGLAVATAVRAAEPVTFTVTITNVSTNETLKLPDGSTTNVPVAPGVFVVGSQPNALFVPGEFASEALERLAEDGNFEPLLEQMKLRKNLTDVGMFVPGQTFTITAKPGDRLSFAAMFVQSNDLFFAPMDGGIALFDKGGRANMGNWTSRVELYDAGTEINQAPGAGPDQAPRQAKPNTGASEHEPIAPVANRQDGFTYPAVSAVIELGIKPAVAKKPQS